MLTPASDSYGPGYGDFEKKQGDVGTAQDQPLSLKGDEANDNKIPNRGNSEPEVAQPIQEETSEQMKDVQGTLQRKLFDRESSFPGVIIDRTEDAHKYTLLVDPSSAMEIAKFAALHGLHPEVGSDGRITITVTGYKKGFGYTGPDSVKEDSAVAAAAAPIFGIDAPKPENKTPDAAPEEAKKKEENAVQETSGLPGGNVEREDQGSGEGEELPKETSGLPGGTVEREDQGSGEGEELPKETSGLPGGNVEREDEGSGEGEELPKETSGLPGGTVEKGDEGSGEGGELPPEKRDKPLEDDSERLTAKDIEAAEKTLEDPNATSAERTAAILTLTQATLDDLDGKEHPKEATDSGIAQENIERTDVEKVTEIKERDETEKKQRSRLMAEVRNPDPMKTAEGLQKEKKDAFSEEKKTLDPTIDAAEQAVDGQRNVLSTLNAQIRNLEQERASLPADKETTLDGKILELQIRVRTEEANMQTLERNRATLVNNLETKKNEEEKDVKMLEKMTLEAEKLARRSALKFDDMGIKLMSLGEKDLAEIAQSIAVQHDDSLGLKMTFNTAAFIEKFDAFLPDAAEEAIKKGDNPSYALRALDAAVKAVERRKEEEKKVKK